MKKGEKILIGAGVGGALLWLFSKGGGGDLHPIVDNQKIRGFDRHGNGFYGATRMDGKTHHGLDIVAQPGQIIKSPITGKVVRYSYPYDDKSYSGYHLRNDKYLIKLWYLAPTLQPGDSIVKGQKVGFAQNIAARYPGITPHVHIEVWDLTKMNVAIDPTKLF